MTQYYFLTTLLPELVLGEKPELSYLELRPLLDANLTPNDREKAYVICRLADLENLRALWNNQPIDLHGNFNKSELEDLLIAQGEEVPSYLIDYLGRYASLEDRISHFPQLVASFFNEEIAVAEGFLKDYLSFERDLRLVMVGFRAKQRHRDVALELQYEDPYDPVVAQILAQKDAASYDPPAGFEELKPLFEKYANAPLDLHKAILEYRLARIAQLTGDALFSVDHVLSYLASLIIIERWNALDHAEGTKVIDSLLKEIT